MDYFNTIMITGFNLLIIKDGINKMVWFLNES